MSYQSVFQRYELKYVLTQEQRERIISAIAPYMTLDQYGRTTICNLYFDTEDYRLIRRSIDAPVYKEKLRVRSYGRVTADGPVFVELKKKYRKVVYKRRIAMPEAEAMDWVTGRTHCGREDQICGEIDYVLKHYGSLSAKVFLSYEREAYVPKDGSDFRVTFDDTIRFRQENLSLCAEPYGERILKDGESLMEIKCSGGMPLWMAHLLSKEHIYKTSFSKYGTAYRTMIYPQMRKEGMDCA